MSKIIKIEYVEDSSFQQNVLNNPNLVLVVFEKRHWGISHIMQPVLEKLVNQFENKITVLKYDLDLNFKIKNEYEVGDSYKIFLFNNGEVIMKLGAVSINELREIINLILIETSY